MPCLQLWGGAVGGRVGDTELAKPRNACMLGEVRFWARCGRRGGAGRAWAGRGDPAQDNCFSCPYLFMVLQGGPRARDAHGKEAGACAGPPPRPPAPIAAAAAIAAMAPIATTFM